MADKKKKNVNKAVNTKETKVKVPRKKNYLPYIIGGAVALVVIGGCIYFFTGSRKTAIDATTFSKLASENGFQTYDMTGNYADYDYVENATLAQNNENLGVQVEYYNLASEDDAKEIYQLNKQEIDDTKEDGDKVKSKSGRNYELYYSEGSSSYKYVCRIQDTMIYTEVPAENADIVKDFIKLVEN